MEIQGMADKGFHKKNYRTEMKVGILTFHRAHNYGAVLQCYALQEILKRKGHTVQIIDYRQPWIEEFYKVFSISMFCDADGLSGKLAYLKKNLKKFLLAPMRNRHFNMFRLDFMDQSLPCGKGDIPQDYDCYVIGSDQLWSLHCLGGVLDEVYFGKFRHKSSSRIIGYAISADMNSVEAIEGELPLLIKGFDALSMREEEIADKVSDISGQNCEVCLDPTLLTDMDIWRPLIDDRWRKRKYVLMYEVRKRDRDLLRRKAEQAAAAIGDGCRVIDLSQMSYSVTDFVSLFRYASHVVTTSFHGCVFSILFERPFTMLPLWNGYDLRYRELLEALNASDRMISADEDIIPGKMDFTKMKASLAELRKSSFSYIDKWIGE